MTTYVKPDTFGTDRNASRSGFRPTRRQRPLVPGASAPKSLVLTASVSTRRKKARKTENTDSRARQDHAPADRPPPASAPAPKQRTRPRPARPPPCPRSSSPFFSVLKSNRSASTDLSRVPRRRAVPLLRHPAPIHAPMPHPSETPYVPPRRGAGPDPAPRTASRPLTRPLRWRTAAASCRPPMSSYSALVPPA